jgi:hypothetical protein
MRVAVTFCNQRSTPRLSVCALDLDTEDRAWLRVEGGFESGAAGITVVDGSLLVACQDGGIVRYGDDLEPTGVLETKGSFDLHSILYRADERAVYVTSTFNDTLYRYTLDASGRRVVNAEAVFCADPSRRGLDRYHINSVAEWKGDLYVSMFGTSDGPSHVSRRNGRVVRVRDGVTLAEGLYHPHTLFTHGDDLFVVESQANTVRRIAGGDPVAWSVPGGYPRGVIAGDDATAWVGVSALRRESKSRATPNVIATDSPLDFRTRLVLLDLTTGAIGRTIDLTMLGREVYDIAPLPAGARFVPDPDRGLTQRVEALEESYRAVNAARRALDLRLQKTPTGRLQRFLQRVRRRVEGAAKAPRSTPTTDS